MTETNQLPLEYEPQNAQADMSIPPSRIVLAGLRHLRYQFEVESIDTLEAREARLALERDEPNRRFDEVQGEFAVIPTLPIEEVSGVINDLCARQKAIWDAFSKTEEDLGAIKEKLVQARSQKEVL